MKRLLLLFLPFFSLAQINNETLNKEFVVKLNEYRIQNGLEPVILDAASIKRAKMQAEYCARVEDLTHDCPAWFPERMAENGLWDSDVLNAKGCLDHWITSPRHDANMLLDGATRIGIWGVEGVLDGDEGFYAFLVIN